MTAAQKTAKLKFKQAIAYRQKTGVSLKEAFAHIYGKKKVGVVKKKAAPKKKVGATDPNKAFKKQMQVNKIINTKYKNWEYPVPPVYTGNWSTLTWSNWIKKNGRKIGAIVRKVVKKKAAPKKKIGNVTLKKSKYFKGDDRYIIMNDGVEHLDGKPFFKETALDIADSLRKVKARRKKDAKKIGYSKLRLEQEKGITKVLKNTPKTLFPYTAKEKIVKAGKKYFDQEAKKISGLHKIVGNVSGKYYIDYTTDQGYKKMEFFNKFPKGYYKGMDRIIYVTRLTKDGTALIPVKYSDNNKDVKK